MFSLFKLSLENLPRCDQWALRIFTLDVLIKMYILELRAWCIQLQIQYVLVKM